MSCDWATWQPQKNTFIFHLPSSFGAAFVFGSRAWKSNFFGDYSSKILQAAWLLSHGILGVMVPNSLWFLLPRACASSRNNQRTTHEKTIYSSSPPTHTHTSHFMCLYVCMAHPHFSIGTCLNSCEWISVFKSRSPSNREGNGMDGGVSADSHLSLHHLVKGKKDKSAHPQLIVFPTVSITVIPPQWNLQISIYNFALWGLSIGIYEEKAD